MVSINLNKVCVGVRSPVCRYMPFTVNRLNPMHWATRSRWTTAWKEEVAWAIYYNKKLLPKFPVDKLKFKIVYRTVFLMDQDNLYGSAKPLIDGIKESGLILDDSPDHVTYEVIQIKVGNKDKQGVEIIFDV